MYYTSVPSDDWMLFYGFEEDCDGEDCTTTEFLKDDFIKCMNQYEGVKVIIPQPPWSVSIKFGRAIVNMRLYDTEEDTFLEVEGPSKIAVDLVLDGLDQCAAKLRPEMYVTRKAAKMSLD